LFLQAPLHGQHSIAEGCLHRLCSCAHVGNKPLLPLCDSWRHTT
jgi:hypothetical protein